MVLEMEYRLHQTLAEVQHVELESLTQSLGHLLALVCQQQTRLERAFSMSEEQEGVTGGRGKPQLLLCRRDLLPQRLLSGDMPTPLKDSSPRIVLGIWQSISGRLMHVIP